MTLPQSPYVQRQHNQNSMGDIITTVVMVALTAIAGVLSFSFSPFFVMATDACGANNCNTQALDWAYVITWGGIGGAAILAMAGTAIARTHGRVMWIWPTAALVLIVLTLVAGGLLADSIVPHH